MLPRLRSFWQALRHRSQFENDLDDEMRFHVETRADDLVRSGLSRDEAMRRARIEFGCAEAYQDRVRESRRINWFEDLAQDLRFGLRMLRKSPGLTTVAILTLAFGIGATSAVFSVVDRILFRSLPYPQEDMLVSFGCVAPIEPREFLGAMDYLDWRKGSAPFSQTTSMIPGAADCDLSEQYPVRMSCAQVESTFLPTFGIQPILGRNFTNEEDQPHAARVALLSYGLWRSRYGSDPRIVGRSISLDGQPTRVLGVLPAQFEMPTLSRADLVVPEALDAAGLRRDGPQPILRSFARLKPGVTVAQAQAALQPLFQQSLQFVPPMFRNEVHLSVRLLRDRQVQDAKLASWLLLGSVLAVLLLACTNVTNLLLARAAVRRREIAVRAALGAGPARLTRQALTESLALSLLGGAIGCFVSYALLRVFISIAPQGIPRLDEAKLDLRVLLFTLGIAVVSGLLFGVAPAWRPPEPEILSGKETQPISRSPLRQILMTAQIAVSLVLLTGAGLLLRSFWNIENVPLGMDVQNVVTAEITLAQYRYPQKPQQEAFFEQLQTRLKRIPGLTSLALSDSLPPLDRGNATIYSNIEVAGHLRGAHGTGGMVGYGWVTPEYFTALGIPILRGRRFHDADLFPSENPIILSDALARMLFPTEEAVGKSMRFGLTGPWRVIIGVAADVKNNGLEARPDPQFYLPWKDDPEEYFGRAHVIIRTPVNSNAMANWLRSEAASVDPAQPLTIETMSQRVSKLADRPRFNAVLLSLFALMGISLAAIGMYGVVGFLVAQRTREIGVRMALGATPQSILKLVLGHVARWTVVGALLGLAGSWFAMRLLRSLLFQVPAHDPWLFCLATAALVAIAFVAGWIPARRAMRVDPMVALRHE
jgi:putative ABC transport system permease protein